MLEPSLKHLKRLIVAVIGITILVIGNAMIVLPGPAIVVIPLGLGILATEFAWRGSGYNVTQTAIKTTDNHKE